MGLKLLFSRLFSIKDWKNQYEISMNNTARNYGKMINKIANFEVEWRVTYNKIKEIIKRK